MNRDALNLKPADDLSLTIAAYPQTKRVQKLLHFTDGEMQKYPPAYEHESAQACIAETLDLHKSEILLTAGGIPVIHAIGHSTKTGEHILLDTPNYTPYFDLEKKFGTRLQRIPMMRNKRGERFSRLRDFTEAVTDKTAYIVLVDPHNPTGAALPIEDRDAHMRELLVTAQAHGTTVLLDQAFAFYNSSLTAPMKALAHDRELVEKIDLLKRQQGQPSLSGHELVAQHPNLLVYYSGSKALGLAGVRAGFVCGAETALAKIQPYIPKYSVSRPAARALCAALRSPDYIAKAVYWNLLNREHIQAGLQNLGYHVQPSRGSAIIVQAPSADTMAFAAKLREHNVIVRPCEEYELHGWVRLSVGDAAQAERVLHAFATTRKKSATRPYSG